MTGGREGLACGYAAARVGALLPAPLLSLAVVVSLGLAACTAHRRPALTRERVPAAVEAGWSEIGIASWYGPGFQGRRTASGERFDQDALTAAHRSLPFGTRARVTLLSSGKSVVVRINDRMPRHDRVIDVSRGAARRIGLIGPGTGRVRLVVVEPAPVR